MGVGVAAWRELGFIFLLNTGISACLELGCVLGVATGIEGPAVWVLPAAIISQAGFLNLVPGLAALGWLLWRRKNGLVTSLLFALLQVALLADVGIFRLFRQHFGPLIWTTLTTPGASDSIRPGATTLLTVAAVLLAGGAKSKRYSLPNSRVVIHQPWIQGGLAGQATDIDIAAKEILRMRERLNEILVQHTGQEVKRIQDDTERDYIMSAEQGKEYGIIDDVIRKRA